MGNSEREKLNKELIVKLGSLYVKHGTENVNLSMMIDNALPIIDKYVEERERAVVQKIWFTRTEGSFVDGELFIKRSPIEQSVIDIIGYEEYKAMTEAATELQTKEKK